MKLHILSIEFTQKTSQKSGKPYTGYKIIGTTNMNTSKELFISDYAIKDTPGLSITSSLVKGNFIEIEYAIKNNFNVPDSIKIIEECDFKQPPPSGFKCSFKSPRSTHVSDTDRQRSIERQNALTNATTLVSSMIRSGSLNQDPVELIHLITKELLAIHESTDKTGEVL